MVSKEEALQKIDQVIQEIEQYREELQKRIGEVHKSIGGVYKTVLDALIKKVKPLNFVVQEVAEERFLFSNWSKKVVQKPMIKYASTMNVRSTNYTKVDETYRGTSIRKKTLIMPDLFEFDVAKLEDIVMKFTFYETLSFIYLRSHKTSGEGIYVPTFEDAKYRYYFFTDFVDTSRITEDWVLECELGNADSTCFCVAVVEGAEVNIYVLSKICAGAYEHIWERTDEPTAIMWIFDGRMDFKRVKDSQYDKTISFQGMLVHFLVTATDVDIMLGDRVIPRDGAIFLRKRGRATEAAILVLTDGATLADPDKRKKLVRRYYYETPRALSIWVPSEEVRLFGPEEWMQSLAGT